MMWKRKNKLQILPANGHQGSEMQPTTLWICIFRPWRLLWSNIRTLTDRVSSTSVNLKQLWRTTGVWSSKTVCKQERNSWRPPSSLLWRRLTGDSNSSFPPPLLMQTSDLASKPSWGRGTWEPIDEDLQSDSVWMLIQTTKVRVWFTVALTVRHRPKPKTLTQYLWFHYR